MERRARSYLRRWRALAWAGLRRYGAQDLAAKAAVVAGAFALEGANAATLAACGAVLDLGAFYAVALVRERRAGPGRTWRACALALACEYGPAELLDLAVRPTAMATALGLCAEPCAALLAGSLAADVVFYACAAGARWVRGNLVRARSAECAKAAPVLVRGGVEGTLP